jgi:hypothetical protein
MRISDCVLGSAENDAARNPSQNPQSEIRNT